MRTSTRKGRLPAQEFQDQIFKSTLVQTEKSFWRIWPEGGQFGDPAANHGMLSKGSEPVRGWGVEDGGQEMENNLWAAIFLKVIIEYLSIQFHGDGQGTCYKEPVWWFSECLNECVNNAFLKDQS